MQPCKELAQGSWGTSCARASRTQEEADPVAWLTRLLAERAHGIIEMCSLRTVCSLDARNWGQPSHRAFREGEGCARSGKGASWRARGGRVRMTRAVGGPPAAAPTFRDPIGNPFPRPLRERGRVRGNTHQHGSPAMRLRRLPRRARLMLHERGGGVVGERAPCCPLARGA